MLSSLFMHNLHFLLRKLDLINIVSKQLQSDLLSGRGFVTTFNIRFWGIRLEAVLLSDVDLDRKFIADVLPLCFPVAVGGHRLQELWLLQLYAISVIVLVSPSSHDVLAFSVGQVSLLKSSSLKKWHNLDKKKYIHYFVSSHQLYLVSYIGLVYMNEYSV